MVDDPWNRSTQAMRRSGQETETQRRDRLLRPREDDKEEDMRLKKEARAIDESRRPKLKFPHPSPAGDVREPNERSQAAQAERYEDILNELEARARQRLRQEERDL
jgi:hypothetical protein